MYYFSNENTTWQTVQNGLFINVKTNVSFMFNDDKRLMSRQRVAGMRWGETAQFITSGHQLLSMNIVEFYREISGVQSQEMTSYTYSSEDNYSSR